METLYSVVSLALSLVPLLNENIWTTTVINSYIASSILQAMLGVFDRSASISICRQITIQTRNLNSNTDLHPTPAAQCDLDL